MSQHTQHCLIRVLLLWVSLLSIIQFVFITLYFTAGHHNRTQNCTGVATTLPRKKNSPSPSPIEHKPPVGKGEMLNFSAFSKTVKGAVEWRQRNKGLVTVNKQFLTTDTDGFYFLSLQVTLKTCKNVSSGPSNLMVEVIKSNEANVTTTILAGWINMDTCSTGLLSRVTELTSEATLVTKINMEAPEIDEKESLTHLDIIYM